MTLFALGATITALAAVELAADVENYARGTMEAARVALSRSDGEQSQPAHYSAAQLRNMPQRPVTAGRGAGFYDLVVCANPGAQDLFSSGTAYEESKYLEHELESRTGHSDLQQGDRLDVPVVPVAGQEPDTRPSVCNPPQNTT